MQALSPGVLPGVARIAHEGKYKPLHEPPVRAGDPDRT
jgi:hypothetical protein